MSIRTTCPSCQAAVNVPESAVGKAVRCGACQQVFQVPQAAAAKPSRPQPAATKATARSAAPTGPKIKCPGCQTVMRLPAGSAGKRVACPRCQQAFRVPGGAAKPGGGHSTSATTPRPRAAASTTRPQPKPQPRPPQPDPADDLSFDFDLGDTAPSPGLPSQPYQPPASSWTPPGRASGAASYSAGSRSGERHVALYLIPAIFIALWAVLMIVGGILRSVGITLILIDGGVPAEAMPRVIGLIVGAVLALIVGVVMLFGSIAMMRRSSLSSARTAAIFAAIPCFGGCVFPIGIWAAVLLFTGSFKRDFSG